MLQQKEYITPKLIWHYHCQLGKLRDPQSPRQLSSKPFILCELVNEADTHCRWGKCLCVCSRMFAYLYVHYLCVCVCGDMHIFAMFVSCLWMLVIIFSVDIVYSRPFPYPFSCGFICLQYHVLMHLSCWRNCVACLARLISWHIHSSMDSVNMALAMELHAIRFQSASWLEIIAYEWWVNVVSPAWDCEERRRQCTDGTGLSCLPVAELLSYFPLSESWSRSTSVGAITGWRLPISLVPRGVLLSPPP